MWFSLDYIFFEKHKVFSFLKNQMNHLLDVVTERACTPDMHQHFFGFHDLCPWDHSNAKLLLHRISKQQPLSIPTVDDTIEIVLWDPDSGQIDAIAETAAWNWQQGGRAQWLRRTPKVLIYNKIVDGRLISERIDLNSGVRDLFPFPCYNLSPDDATFVSCNLGRLNKCWPAYGAAGRMTGSEDEHAPDDDGLFMIDLQSGQERLIISLAELVEGAEIKLPDGTKHFVCHPTFSPSGERICFFHRFFSKEQVLFSRFIVCDVNGNNPRLIANEKVSHFDWIDDDTIVVWTRFLPKNIVAARSAGGFNSPFIKPLVQLARRLKPNIKQSLWKEAYFQIDLTGNSEPTPIANGILEQDGHPMFSHDGKWMLTDTYADPKTRTRTLILFNMHSRQRFDLACLDSPIEFGDGDMKCDLHPRWDRDCKRICVDSTHTGLRQVHIYDVSAWIERE